MIRMTIVSIEASRGTSSSRSRVISTRPRIPMPRTRPSSTRPIDSPVLRSAIAINIGMKVP